MHNNSNIKVDRRRFQGPYAMSIMLNKRQVGWIPIIECKLISESQKLFIDYFQAISIQCELNAEQKVEKLPFIQLLRTNF